MKKKEIMIVIASAAATILSGILHYSHANAILTFFVLAGALALVAMLVGDATEQLGSKMGPGVTGILQSGLGNLPELFVCIFALKAGMANVVQAALVGSILGNSLLVFGLALFLGGIKNGTQIFKSEPPKLISTLMILAFAALCIPTFATKVSSPAAAHIHQLDIVVAIALLCVFVASIYFSIKGDKALTPTHAEEEGESWSMPLTLAVLLGAGVAAAFVSDWFVDALTPAMNGLGINQTFAGLVIVAIAGNAIENVVGIQLAIKNQSDYAVSVILNSSLQVALGLFPILVLLSYVLGGAVLTFVLSPMLIVALGLTVIATAFIVFDGESIWIEGLALLGLYAIIAASFWWG